MRIRVVRTSFTEREIIISCINMIANELQSMSLRSGVQTVCIRATVTSLHWIDRGLEQVHVVVVVQIMAAKIAFCRPQGADLNIKGVVEVVASVIIVDID